MKDKEYRRVRDDCHFTAEYRGAAHIIYNLKYSMPTEIPIVFHNRSNYDYRFIIKELAEELKVHYQILSIIFLKEFIKLNVNMDMKIENVKLVKLNISITTVFVNI